MRTFEQPGMARSALAMGKRRCAWPSGFPFTQLRLIFQVCQRFLSDTAVHDVPTASISGGSRTIFARGLLEQKGALMRANDRDMDVAVTDLRCPYCAGSRTAASPSGHNMICLDCQRIIVEEHVIKPRTRRARTPEPVSPPTTTEPQSEEEPSTVS